MFWLSNEKHVQNINDTNQDYSSGLWNSFSTLQEKQEQVKNTATMGI